MLWRIQISQKKGRQQQSEENCMKIKKMVWEGGTYLVSPRSATVMVDLIDIH